MKKHGPLPVLATAVHAPYFRMHDHSSLKPNSEGGQKISGSNIKW